MKPQLNTSQDHPCTSPSLTWSYVTTTQQGGHLRLDLPMTNAVEQYAINQVPEKIQLEDIFSELRVENEATMGLGMLSSAGLPALTNGDIVINSPTTNLVCANGGFDPLTNQAIITGYTIPVKVAPSTKWSFFDILSVENAQIDFTIMNPYLQTLSTGFFDLKCDLNIPGEGNAVIELSASFPNYILQGSLVKGDLNIGHAISYFLNGVDIQCDKLSSLEINKLDFSGNFQSKVFQVDLESDNSWTLFSLTDSHKLEVTDLYLHALYAPQSNFSLSLDGTLKVFDVDVSITAEYETNKGFTLLKGCVSPDSLDPGALSVESILTDVFDSSPPPLPHFLSSLSLELLQVEICPQSMSFSCDLILKGDSHIGGIFKIISSSLHVSKTGSEIDLSAFVLFQVGDLNFSINGTYQNKNFTFQGSLIAETPPSLETLLSPLLPTSVTEVIPQNIDGKYLSNVDVSYDEQEKYFSFIGKTTEGDELKIGKSIGNLT